MARTLTRPNVAKSRVRPEVRSRPPHPILEARIGRTDAGRRHNAALLAVVALGLLALPISTERASRNDYFGSSTTSTAAIQRAALPISFEENAGQADPAVTFIARTGGQTVFFTHGGVIFVSPKPRSREGEFGDRRGLSPRPAPDVAEEPMSAAVLHMDFVGASPEARVTGHGGQENKTNYFHGNDPSKWRTNISNYSIITYQALYAGIDLTFYQGGDGGLEYDFVVGPGTDSGAIKLDFAGADSVTISGDGDLIATGGGVEHRQARPYVYQESPDGDREQVSAGFVVSGAEVRFEIGDYDRARPLIIDPTIEYSSYLGGTYGDSSHDVAVDISGSAYVIGETFSSDFPIVSAFQPTCQNCNREEITTLASEAFVTKISPSGSSIVYSSFLGGSGTDSLGGVAVDAEGNAYVAGGTESPDFPTVAAFQPQVAGFRDATITKISPSGASLVYSTFLGGSESDGVGPIALSPAGDAVVVGRTYSDDFPTLNPFEPFCNPPVNPDCNMQVDGILARFSAAGTLLSSSYLGGNGASGIVDMAMDGQGNIYLAGSTQSTTLPVFGAFQPSMASSWSEGFVTKLNAAGSGILYSSYLGGTGQERARSIAVDPGGNAYVSGDTDSFDFPVKNAFKPAIAGATDSFITKVNANGNGLVYSSYLGGTNREDQTGYVAVDLTGNAYVVGTTNSDDFPLANPFQAVRGGEINVNDAYITKVNPAGTGLVYSSYLGGSSSEAALGVAVDAGGDAYVVGGTVSTDFPLVGAFQPTCGGCGPPDYTGPGFITKIHDPGPPPALSGTTTNSLWAGVSVYNAVTGTVAAYQCCNTSESWSVQVTPSSCSAGGGYKVLMLPIEGYQSRWYNDKPNFSQADCVDSPSTDNNSALPPTGVLTGYVKDAATATDINGAMIYFYNSSGVFVGWTKSGRDGPGRFRQYLSSSDTYKVLVVGPPGYEDIWSDGAMGFGEATPTSSPASVNFSLRAAGTISGQTFQLGSLLPGVYVSAYPSCGCTSPKNARSDAGANYSIKVPTTASSGNQYRLRFIPPTGQTRWYSASTSFGGADDVSAPNTNINVDTPP